MSEPSVGVFCFDTVEKRLCSIRLSIDESIRTGGFRGSGYIYLPLDWSKAWDQLRGMNPRWAGVWSNEDIPRGRVNWNKGTLGFEIAMSPCLKGEEELIKMEFGIRENDACIFDHRQQEFFTMQDLDRVLKSRHEFPSYELKDMPDDIKNAVLKGWIEDVSWHNDSMPSFSANGLTLWVDFRERKLREFSEGKRFAVSRADDDANAPLIEFEEEGKVPSALELMNLAGVDVKALEPAELIRRLVRIVGLGFSFTTPVAEYGLGWGNEVQEALNSAVKALGERKAYETAFLVWKNELARRRRV